MSLIQEMSFCSNIWRSQMLIVHAKIENKDTRLISTSKTTTTTTTTENGDGNGHAFCSQFKVILI
jgi:glucose-6-phosphate isomerase